MSIKDKFQDLIKNKTNNNENKSIMLMSKEETEQVLRKMNEINNDAFMEKIRIMENHISMLHNQINVMIEQEKQTQEFIVNLMTTVEEVLHTLEEAGLASNAALLNDEVDDLIINTDIKDHKNDDVASSNYDLKKQFSNGYMNDPITKKDFKVN